VSQAVREFLVGCYTFGAGGRGRRIEIVAHDPVTGRWELRTDHDVAEPIGGASAAEQPESPSYLAWHPDGRHVYATGEVSDGQVWALRVAPGGHGLGVLGSASTGGAHPCHLAVDPSGTVLLTANYSSGNLAVHRLRPDGRIGARTQLVQHEGSGPHPDRQRGPHAHMVYVLREPGRANPQSGDRSLVLAVDLGADLIAGYWLDPAAAALTAVSSSSMPDGFGPRHLIQLGDDLVAVAGELTGEIALLRLEAGTGALTVLDVRAGSDFTGEPAAPSGIGRTADGRFVLMANRGPDTVAAFRVQPGRLRRVDEIACGGEHPRDITVLGRHVYVANQESDTITVLTVDPDTGALAGTSSLFRTPSPTQVLPTPDAVNTGHENNGR